MATTSAQINNNIEAYIEKNASHLDAATQYRLSEKMSYLTSGPYAPEIPVMADSENFQFMEDHPELAIDGYTAYQTGEEIGLYNLREELSEQTGIPAENIDMKIDFSVDKNTLTGVTFSDSTNPTVTNTLSDEYVDLLNKRIDWVQQNHPPMEAMVKENGLPEFSYQTQAEPVTDQPATTPADALLGNLGLTEPEKPLNREQTQLLQGGLRAMGYEITQINGEDNEETQTAMKQFIQDAKLDIDSDMDQESLIAVQQQVMKDSVVENTIQGFGADPASLGGLDQIMFQIVMVLKGLLSSFTGALGSQFNPDNDQDAPKRPLGIVENVGLEHGIPLSDRATLNKMAKQAFDGLDINSEFRPSAKSIAQSHIKLHGQELSPEDQARMAAVAEKYESIPVTQEDIDELRQQQKDEGLAANREWMIENEVMSENGEILDEARYEGILNRYMNDEYMAELHVRDIKFREMYPDEQTPGVVASEIGLRHYGANRRSSMIDASAEEQAVKLTAEAEAKAEAKNDPEPDAKPKTEPDQEPAATTATTAIAGTTIATTSTTPQEATTNTVTDNQDSITANPINPVCGKLSTIWEQAACEQTSMKPETQADPAAEQELNRSRIPEIDIGPAP